MDVLYAGMDGWIDEGMNEGMDGWMYCMQGWMDR